MIRATMASLILAAGLAMSWPAAAQECLSAGEARAAVAQGQVAPLSRILGAIKQAAPGQILPSPSLCRSGDRYVYRLNVLTSGNRVTRLTVDAASGAILGN